MRFFFDRNISFRLANMIAAFRDGTDVIGHLDSDPRFSPRTPNEVWLKAIGEDRPTWAVVTGDLAILTRDAERRALEEADLMFLGFEGRWPDKMSFPEQAWRLVKTWPEIAARAASESGQPTIFKVH